MGSGGARRPAQPGSGWAKHWLLVLLAAALAASSAAAGHAAPAAASAPSLDAGGAYAFLAFARDLQQGRPWSEAAIRRMAASVPYQAMIAHHASLDPGVTAEAFVTMLLALRDGRPYSGPMSRLTRVYATYKAALARLPELEARLQAICATDLAASALAKARAGLPPGVPLPARVYLLVDGFTAAYCQDDAIMLDLLQVSGASDLQSRLAHELHLAGTATLLPRPCPDPQLGLALDTLAGMVQEGAATAWLDGWRASPTQADSEQVAGFMRALLSGDLQPEDAEPWFTALIDDGREGGGPLYRVGNAMIAELTKRRGQAWVQARLSDPVALLRDWQGPPSAPFHEVWALLDRARDRCPAWFPGSH